MCVCVIQLLREVYVKEREREIMRISPVCKRETESVYVYVYVCICVCKRERERERERA